MPLFSCEIYIVHLCKTIRVEPLFKSIFDNIILLPFCGENVVLCCPSIVAWIWHQVVIYFQIVKRNGENPKIGVGYTQNFSGLLCPYQIEPTMGLKHKFKLALLGDGC